MQIMIDSFQRQQSIPDRIVCKERKDGLFSVKPGKSIILKKVLSQSRKQELIWPWKLIWRNKVPYKVECFSW